MILVNNLLTITPYLLLLVVLTFLPGYALTQFFNKRAGFIKNLALAPALTLALITVATLVFKYLPLTWGIVGFTLFVAVFIGIFWLASLRSNNRTSGKLSKNQNGLTIPITDFKYILLGWLVLIVPMLGYADFSRVIQGGDSNYHYNQVLWIAKTGDIFPLTANAGLGGLNPSGWYYPTTWHAYVYLLVDAGASVIVATAAFLLLLPLIWLISISALTVNLSRHKGITRWAVVAAMLVPLATVRLAHVTTLWPFITALTVVPGVIAYVLEKTPPKKPLVLTYLKVYAGRLVAAALIIIGLTGLHPSVVVVPGMGLFFAAVVLGFLNIRYSFLKQDWKSVVFAVFTIVFLIGSFLFFIYGPGPQQGQLHRVPNVGWGIPVMKLASGSGVFVTAPFMLGFITWGLVLLLIPIAIWLHIKQRKYLVLAALLSQWLVVMGSLFPLPMFSELTSFYYNVADRTKFAYVIYLIPVLALTLQTIFTKTSERFKVGNSQVVASALIIALGILNFAGTMQDLNNALYPEKYSVRYLANQEELDLIKRLGSELKDTDLLLGDPAAGASLVYTLTGKPVVWKYPNSSSGSADDNYLQANFYNYREDPKVCELINKYGITHFYKDISGTFNGNFTWRLRPGLYAVDTSEDAFELVDKGSTVEVYKITYCQK
ncbi:hypothetical protein HMPREF0044_0809 [Gleimia coleocanis DSM 15436]|uniref:Tat pathway signal sequence domain protein n=1 Tax=Gleimia coleocanis DSM 15436 TaxID=525245 RepID=C0VZT1_9ACTO|nr:DUF6541 family protein [Gleimia coleocanis]EEH63790.1 hypothetical protein HMPREF0044_0809 [Gleimia coleocanis DSM 15436]